MRREPVAKRSPALGAPEGPHEPNRPRCLGWHRVDLEAVGDKHSPAGEGHRRLLKHLGHDETYPVAIQLGKQERHGRGADTSTSLSHPHVIANLDRHGRF